MRLIRLLKRDLATEIATWVERELISIDQARAICRLYGVDYDTVRSRSAGYGVLVVLGFLFIGLALITIIGANWDAIPRELRTAGLLALTAGTHALALKRHLSGRISMATGLFVLGNLFYGASIILIAQIHHLGEHMPDGVFWWALGSVPFAILLCSPWLALMSGLLALIWFYLESLTGFLNGTFLSIVFPLFLVAELYVLVRGRSSVLLFLTFVASLSTWLMLLLGVLWAESGGRLEWTEEHLFAGAALFILAHGAGRWLEAKDGAKARDYGVVLSIWTLRFALVGMFVLSFERPWLELLRDDWAHQGTMWVVVGGLVAGGVWLDARAGARPAPLALAAVAVATMIAVVVAADPADPSRDPDYVIPFQVFGNAALVGAGIWLIVRGTTAGVSHWFFLGVTVILLTALLRYVDLIGDYLGGAALFLVFAALLLGVARFWRTRQRREARP